MSEESNDPKRDHYINLTILGLMALFFLLRSYYTYRSLYWDVVEKDLRTFRGTITEDAKISSGRSGSYIEFKVLLLPDFEFMISGISYQAVKERELTAEVKKNDTIEIDILKSEFEKKISKTKPLSFFDRNLNFDLIYVYGFRKNKKEYLTLENYNKFDNEDAKSRWWFLLIVSFGWMIGMYFERRHYKKKYLS
jgi:hypothetical protein